MVDLGGYVIIVTESKVGKVKLYGSPADKGDLEVGDEILEVNGKSLEDISRTEILSHIYQCIRSRTICMRVKRRSPNKIGESLDFAQPSNVQDAFVIAVEAQARERLERLSALKRIKPVDITKVCYQQSKEKPESELNGFLENTPIYVTSYPPPPGTGSTPSSAPSSKPSSAPGSVKKSPLSNGHSQSQADDQVEEIELKQEFKSSEDSTSTVTPSRDDDRPVQLAAESAGSGPGRRASSPFSNGRTELLIGQDVPQPAGEKVKTTALVENKSVTATPPDCITRPRRRSGSALVEADKVSGGSSVAGDDAYSMMVMMGSLENGPHREMPVDVPDSFIARSKTPPRYPPPRPANRGAVNGNAGSPGKPVPPPREPLPLPRPPPVVAPVRTINNNTTAELSKEPTKQQLASIKKYEEQLRKRREDEERAAQLELANRSLRGSKKLQALESRPGVVNDAFTQEETVVEDTLHKVIGYGEVVASLQRLQSALKRSGLVSLEPSLAAVQSLLSGPAFSRAISTHNKIQQVWSQANPPRPLTDQAQTLARDCLECLQSSSSAEAIELSELLGRYEFEELLTAHDLVSKDVLVGPAASPIAVDMPPTAPMDPPRSRAPTPLHEEEESNIKIIKIEKTNEPLGATVRNEGESVMIGRVVRGGAADKSGLLHEGDEVLEVNGIEMRGKTVNEVCDLLSAMTGTLTFLIVPTPPVYTHIQHRTDSIMHMKANFDYDPEDDMYIPCRELGISFQKGDILHVISQDDPNWWQAYREGEEDQTLAGLIPSKSFQHQRESMKQSTITGDKLHREKSRKAGTFLCAKKNTKKKKKKSYSDSGYPIYSASEDYEEEITTYDEVALYYPRANHKRPIVLIGPPNIGRHELRQRLMEDSDRFAAAIPHTSRTRKDGEVDGQDYHFITRAQFEADILARKFVEHGEYEKAYYGTSLDAIRSVVNAGRICVLNLHPQSLKILRNSDLKPYVVFVAPPSLEKLRQKKIRNGETYKEEELKDIIEKAREMEDKYGHYFDMIINNNDTERAYIQLLNEINILEREPQWVPASWVKSV